MKVATRFLLAAVFAATTAQASPVVVEIVGSVEYNQIQAGPFNRTVVTPGSAARIEFTLDSNSFVDSPSYPTRGYLIEPGSFMLTLGPVTVGLQNPFPAGETPYFVIRNNDPAVDGFFLSRNVDGPNGVPVDVPGLVGPYLASQFAVSYTGSTLGSLDLLSALGTYDYTGIGSFYFVIDDGGFEPVGLIYDHMTLSAPVPTHATTWGAVKSLYR